VYYEKVFNQHSQVEECFKAFKSPPLTITIREIIHYDLRQQVNYPAKEGLVVIMMKQEIN